MDILYNIDSSDEQLNTKINLDELYEKKQSRDLSVLNTYNKILNRIHTRIKTISNQQINDQFCWFLVPEIQIGVPKFDKGACTAYLIDKLRDNGFIIRYIHPNLLFISWKHWIPTYVRNELKKKTGINIDGYGNKIEKSNQEKNMNTDSNDINSLILNNKSDTNPKTSFKSIDSYKPMGVYNPDILKKLDIKFNK